MTSKPFTPAQLRRLCAEWQARLRLRDWDVTIAYDRSEDFLAQGCEGLCRMAPPLKRATISILHPDDYPEGGGDQDIEEVVVHEVLHLHFVMFAQGPEDDGTMSAETVLMEQSTEIIAQALVAARRSTPPCPSPPASPASSPNS